MLKIRLTRVGKKNSPAYRVVVADQKRAVQGKFLEIIGNYNPTLKPKTLVIDKERALFWISKGAQASDTVKNLMCNLGILPETDRVKKVYAKKVEEVVEVAPAVEAAVEEVTTETPVEEVAVEEVAVKEVAVEVPVEVVAEEVAPVAEVEAPVEVVAEEVAAEETVETETPKTTAKK